MTGSCDRLLDVPLTTVPVVGASLAPGLSAEPVPVGPSGWLAGTLAVSASILLAALVLWRVAARRARAPGLAREAGEAWRLRGGRERVADRPPGDKDEARAIFETAHDAYVAIDPDSAILEWNRQAEEVFGWRRDEVVGRNMAELIIPPRFREAHFQGIRHFLASGEGPVLSKRVEVVALHRRGHEFPVELTIWPTRRGGSFRFHAFLHDISRSRRVVRRLAGQTAAAAALVDSLDGPQAAVARFLAAICSALGWPVGVLWVPDASSDALRCAELWHDGGAGLAAFERTTRDLVLPPGVGLPGRVLQSRQPEWVPGFGHDGGADRAEDAAAAGLGGAFAWPILSRGGIFAVLEFFSRDVQEPDAELLAMMESLGNLLGQFIARIEAERELERSRRLLSEAQHVAKLGSWEWEIGPDRVRWTDEMFRLYGLESRHFQATYAGFLARVHPDDRARVKNTVDASIESKRPFELDHRVSGADGSVRVLHARGAVVTDAEGQAIRLVGTVQDVTQRREVEHRLQRLAHFDPLTGLPNRRLFQESLLKAMARADAQGWSIFLMFLDLDNFKDINDSLGHAVGDELLRQMGQRLLNCLRLRDTVGRLGGDEFGVIVLTPGDDQMAVAVAEKIRAALRVPFELEGNSVTATVSIGITVYPADSDDVHDLVRYVDLAMYEAKRAGRNAYRFYTEEMNRRAAHKRLMESALREALAEGEFALHYQPKVSLSTGRWTGVEALLRWNRPGHGMVAPAGFIEGLEKTGLIVPVGIWVLATACRQLRDWRRIGMAPLSIAVNVSARQMGREKPSAPPPGPPGQARQNGDSAALWAAAVACLQEQDVSPGDLELELTESTLMSDAEFSIDILRRLKDLGVPISVDDFGTGYSNLAYLRRLPLDAIKIDGTFIHAVTRNPDDASITLAIIDLAHRLNLQVIAEGVETEEQLRFLQANGCDQAQGYHLARPMPAGELEALWQATGGIMPNVV